MAILKTSTPAGWAAVALKDFDSFLLDHASCERKASAVGMSFVVRYPDRIALIDPMIQFAREELQHFHQVYRLIQKRGLLLGPDQEDAYVNRLMKSVRSGRDERLLDRLLVSSLIEARGHERLALVARELGELNEPDAPKLKLFYARLARAEGHHKDLFVRMAKLYFPDEVIDRRMEELSQIEAEAILHAPHRSALH